MNVETCNRGHTHHEKVIDNIGLILVEHGERDDCDACLCGHHYYMECPAKLSGWIEPWLTATYTPSDQDES